MKKIEQKLFITFSNQRKRELINLDQTGPLDKVVTLDNLILEYFEANSFNKVLSPILGRSIIYQIISNNSITYFEYLKDDSHSLNTIYDFIVKCNRNDISYGELISGKKLEAINRISVEYLNFKESNNLSDISDIEDFILDNYNKDYFSKYTEVIIDNFVYNEVSFIQSYKQKELLKLFKDAKQIDYSESDNSPCNLYYPSNPVFDKLDEVKTALKISRKLMEDGVSDSEILIVVSDINEYSSLFKLYLQDYDMEAFSSKGTPLSSYSYISDDKVKAAGKIAQNEIKKLKEIYNNLSIPFTNTIEKYIRDSISVPDKKIGIEITEANQFIGIKKSIDNIIFVGANINTFPPIPTDNFLYSYEDDIKYFYSNDYYTSSNLQYKVLTDISKKLYIVTGEYEGSKEVSPSIIVHKKEEVLNRINVSDISSTSELSLKGNVVSSSESIEYFKSLLDLNFTEFDGLNVPRISAKHLSASKINTYLTCPLQYLYRYGFRVKPPKNNNEGFDNMQKGSLMHLCFELFGLEVKKLDRDYGEKEFLYNLMYMKSTTAYTEYLKNEDIEGGNIHHNLFLSTLQSGLKNDKKPGLLVKFVDYYIDNASNLNYLKSSQFEKEFTLDKDLKPKVLKSKEDNNYFIKGYIDRYDNMDNIVNIIDYKSSTVNYAIKKSKKKEIEELKNIQLALYLLYATQVEGKDKVFNSQLLSFKAEKPIDYSFANMSTEVKEGHVLFDDNYRRKLKDIIYNTKSNIESGKFTFNNSDDKSCEWCDIKNICHQNILNKAMEVQGE